MSTARKITGTRSKTPLYEEVRIDSWESLVEALGSLSPNWTFRGHSDATWPLQSTLARRFNATGIHRTNWADQEDRILRIFKRKAHLFLDHIPDDEDSFRWLGMMQHHGAPTRLLDFTWSFYVAAFFALEGAIDDAAIWAVNLNVLDEPVKLIMDGRRKKVSPEDLGPWTRGNYEKYFLDNTLSFVLYGEPRIMNQRLIAQSGTFIIPSTLFEPVEDILSHYSNPKALVKYVLSTSKFRSTAMRKLYSMNVTYYTLFPGLDGLARSMGFESEYNWAFDPIMKRKRE
jgi:hypothetical protein